MTLFTKLLWQTLYPSFCLYCNTPLASSEKDLCLPCFSTLQIALHPPLSQQSYCFEAYSAATCLLEAFSKTQFLRLKTLIVSLMMVKFCALKLPMPDLVVPALHQESLRGDGDAIAYAEMFASLLSTKYCSIFKYLLSDSVYNGQGEWIREVCIKDTLRTRAARSVLIIDTYENRSSEYRELLRSQGVTETFYLSFISDKTLLT